MNIMNIGCAGGGSGGHVMPIASLIEFSQNNNYTKNNDSTGESNKIYWFGSPNSLEATIAENMDVYFVSLYSGKRRSYWGRRPFLANMRDIFLLTRGCVQAIYYLRKFRISVLFCKGGYVALPVVLAARFLGIPCVVHESDSTAGKTNRIAMRTAKVVFTGLPPTKGAISDKYQQVGQLLSLSLTKPVKVPLSYFDKNKVTILVLLGSQGSTTILSTLVELLSNDMNIQKQYNRLIVTGSKNHNFFECFAQYQVNCFRFCNQHELGYLYSISDRVITRGSATSLAEQKLFDISSVIIPLPYTGGNHQYTNALYYEKKYNDTVLKQNDSLKHNLRDIMGGGLQKKIDQTTHMRREKEIEKTLETVWHAIITQSQIYYDQ